MKFTIVIWRLMFDTFEQPPGNPWFKMGYGGWTGSKEHWLFRGLQVTAPWRDKSDKWSNALFFGWRVKTEPYTHPVAEPHVNETAESLT
jgi:hypothetical protein